MLGHLFLFYFSYGKCKEAIENLWKNYIERIKIQDKKSFEKDVIIHIGATMLLRLNGIIQMKIDKEKKEKMIKIAEEIIMNDNLRIEDLFKLTGEV